MHRRRFMLGLGGGLAAAVGGSWAIRPSRWGSSSPAEPVPATTFTRTDRALGTELSITVHHSDARLANRSLDDAFAELARVESLMSIYRSDSSLSQLNQHRVLLHPHPDLVQVLEAATEMARRSEGAFDVTVQPLWSLYQQAQARGELPSVEAVRRARGQVDWRSVLVSRDKIELLPPATAITLNGIAQGFAADKAAEALRCHGIRHALIDAGEVGTVGGSPEGRPWKVGIQHPRRPDAFLSLAELQGRCLATSGDYATTFSEDFRHHHLFDPRTGQSPEELASVSVAAPSALVADALSTAVFVLGSSRGADLVARTPGADALMMLKNGLLQSTPGFPLEV